MLGRGRVCEAKAFYEKYSTLVFSHVCEVPGRSPLRVVSARMLSQCLFVMIRISGVVEKYHGLLLPGVLKLFYIDRDCVHDFIHVTLAKWPIGASKKVGEDVKSEG